MQKVDIKSIIKYFDKDELQNLMLDKDIFAKYAVATSMSSLHRLSQVLIWA